MGPLPVTMNGKEDYLWCTEMERSDMFIITKFYSKVLLNQVCLKSGIHVALNKMTEFFFLYFLCSEYLGSQSITQM